MKIKLAKKGINIPFYDILEMKDILLENKNCNISAIWLNFLETNLTTGLTNQQKACIINSMAGEN